MHPILLYTASALTALWGVAHLFATRGVVAGFGEVATWSDMEFSQPAVDPFTEADRVAR